MAEQKFYTPLKIGLLAVVCSYFLFTFHAMFTLSWIGEWDRLGGGAFGTMILVEDISATIGLVFRVAASILAFAAVVYYLAKKNISKSTAYKVLRWTAVFEGIYWLGLIATAGYTVLGFGYLFSRNPTLFRVLDSLLLGVIPTVVEAIVLPVSLFLLAFKLNPTKPMKAAIKWASITGMLYIMVFWLVNSSIWVGVAQNKGVEYLTAYPEHLVSFIVTVFGLAALTIFTAYFAKKSSGKETLQELKWGTVGAITLALGMFYLWNYFSWVFFAGDTWNNWYAWFLGHNMDLWMLSLPLVALPLLFYKSSKQPPKAQ
jgi:hypothetical protein